VSEFEDLIWAQLKEVFPNYKIVRQHHVNYFGTALYFDFYIPAMNVLIECQGEQHYYYRIHPLRYCTPATGRNIPVSRPRVQMK